MNDHSYRDETEMHRGLQSSYSSTMALFVGPCPGSTPVPGANGPTAPLESAPPK